MPRTGRPARTVEQAKAIIEANVKKTNIGCWEWQKSRYPSGYGAFYWRGDQRAHRSSYRIYHLDGEPIPEGVIICHTCDNPCCVNPDCLYAGSQQQNHDDKWTRGRGIRGEKVHTAKLTGLDVVVIRKKHSTGTSMSQIAREHGLSKTHVGRIVRGECWKHLL